MSTRSLRPPTHCGVALGGLALGGAMLVDSGAGAVPAPVGGAVTALGSVGAGAPVPVVLVL
jgi:hypothetical protein